jgi:hypothetical protein
MSQLLKFCSPKPLLCGLAMVVCFGLTGCMGEYSGQNLPSPYYLGSQLQYYPSGPEFKLTQEAAAQKQFRETEAQRQGIPVPQ